MFTILKMGNVTEACWDSYILWAPKLIQPQSHSRRDVLQTLTWKPMSGASAGMPVTEVLEGSVLSCYMVVGILTWYLRAPRLFPEIWARDVRLLLNSLWMPQNGISTKSCSPKQLTNTRSDSRKAWQIRLFRGWIEWTMRRLGTDTVRVKVHKYERPCLISWIMRKMGNINITSDFEHGWGQIWKY